MTKSKQNYLSKILKIMETTKKELIGINTYLFSFPLDCRKTFRLEMEKMSHVGTVTEVFLNNELGFEVKLLKKI